MFASPFQIFFINANIPPSKDSLQNNLVVILKTQSRKKPNNPFKGLLKQRIILCAFQNSKVRQDKEIF